MGIVLLVITEYKPRVGSAVRQIQVVTIILQYTSNPFASLEWTAGGIRRFKSDIVL